MSAECPGRDACVTRVQQRTDDGVRLVGLMLRRKHSGNEPEGELGHAHVATLGFSMGGSVALLHAATSEVAHRIAPTPLLLVHGDRDHYLGVDHPLAVRRATGGHAELWLERGARHAETALSPELVDRMAAWLTGTSRTNESERTAA